MGMSIDDAVVEDMMPTAKTVETPAEDAKVDETVAEAPPVGEKVEG